MAYIDQRCTGSIGQGTTGVSVDVVIDITRLLGQFFDGRQPTGVDRVSLAYIDHYRHRARALLRWRGRSSLTSSATSKEIFGALLDWNLSRSANMRSLIIKGVISSIWRGDGKGAFLLHTGHNDAEADALWRNLRWHRLRPVFFVHDLIPITHPQFCRAGEPQRHSKRLDRMLESAAVIANSQTTLNQLTAYAQIKDKLLPPSCVALLAAGSQFNFKTAENLTVNFSAEQSLSNSNIPKTPYYVVLGTVEPRKNHALLLSVWRSWGPEAPLLVVIGRPGWDNELVIAQLQDSSALNSRVVWMKDANDEQLINFVAGARALLFPSFVEGFGIPLAEALALGTPVIAGNLAVYKEFAGDVPLYLPTDDTESWLQAVRDYLPTNSPQREAQTQRIKSLQLPTWPQHFTHVDALLHSLNLVDSTDTAKRLRLGSETYAVAEQKFQGFSLRKKSILQRYLRGIGFGSAEREFVWGAHALTRQDVVCVEDGFIRSVGLGADLTAPLSWVFDTRGIYFDATKTSDLEVLLEQAAYTDVQLLRAASLRQTLVSIGVTKYNLASQIWRRPDNLGSKQVVLVAGQVESDASIRLGAHAVRTNAQLLQTARARCPHAYIVYKPHPDVVAGLRSGGFASQHNLKDQYPCADEVLLQADMAQLLCEVDEVHVITSLTGFEALMRGVAVVVYGAPFYAGWGLTRDIDLPTTVSLRRTKKLQLDELVAAALIDYPVYLDPNLDVLITPEQALVILQKQKQKLLGQPASGNFLQVRRFLLRCWAKLRGYY
jgi:glycosyltransferase involved in cell wall biosynthesis